jgi:hypothetical protein
MSSSEYEISSDTCSDTCSDTESYDSFAEALEELREKLESFDTVVEELHDGCKKIENPVTGIAVNSFVQPKFLESAPFRTEKFHSTKETQELFECPEIVSFTELCAVIRNYIFKNKLVQPNCKINLTLEPAAKKLQNLLQSEYQEITFLGILQHIHKFIV